MTQSDFISATNHWQNQTPKQAD